MHNAIADIRKFIYTVNISILTAALGISVIRIVDIRDFLANVHNLHALMRLHPLRMLIATLWIYSQYYIVVDIHQYSYGYQ